MLKDRTKEELEIAEAMNRLAREQSKVRLILDIQIDIEICKLEGWDYREYLEELKDIIDSFYNIREEKQNGIKSTELFNTK